MENSIQKPEVGTILFTKDGRKVGNAIITDEVLTSAGESFVIQTDYGSKAVLTTRELTDMFYFDFETYSSVDLLNRRASHKFARDMIGDMIR